MMNWLQNLANIATIITTIVTLCLFVGGYKWYRTKKSIKGNRQSVNGEGNIQAGGNIHQNGKGSTSNDSVKNISGNKQSIKGNNNKQAGGDING